MKTCWNISDFPPDAHYCIIETSSIYVPGDERSRSCPGHGYPGGNEPIIRYYAFTDIQEWKDDIAKRVERNKKDFIAFQVSPVRISTTINVEVDL